MAAEELAREGMTQSSPPTCTWRPGDAEALRIALSIPVTAAALAALNREMAQLQTHYPTGVCTAQGHLDAIAALDQQLAALTPAEVNSPVRSQAQGRGRWRGAQPAAAEQVGGGGVRHRAAAGGNRERVEPCGPVTGGGAEPAAQPAHRPAGAAAAAAAELAPVQPRPLPGITGAGLSDGAAPLAAEPGPQPPAGCAAVGPAGVSACSRPGDRQPGGPARCPCSPLWLALQPYANARLCLFEVDRPESRNPVPIRRHVIDCFLEQSGIVSGYNDTALTDPGDVLLRGYLCRAAILPVSTSNTFDWLAAELDWATPGFRDEAPLPWDPTLLGTVQAPCQGVMWLGDLALLQPQGGLPVGGRAQFAGCQVMHFGADYGPGGIGLLLQPLLGEAIQLVLRPHSVLVLRDGDTLNLIAERYGTTVATLRRINPQLESTQTITAVEGDSLAVLAGRHGTTETKLRSLNPVLQQSEAYVSGRGRDA